MHSDSEGRLILQLSAGRHLEVDLTADTLIVLATPGIRHVLTWMRDITIEGVHLRISCKRTDTGIELWVDRGDQTAQWWPSGLQPQLHVHVTKKSVEASALVGSRVLHETLDLKN
jgi:hypothetical protein